MTNRAQEEYRYEKLTWPEINDAVELGKVCLAALRRRRAARAAPAARRRPRLPRRASPRGRASQSPTRCWCCPSSAYGYTGHVMDFPGTINTHYEHFIDQVLDITKSLAYHGFKKIILLNGHGSNWPNLDLVARRTNLETDAECVPICWWNLLTVDKEFLPRWRQSKFPGGCSHACELETSLYLYLDGDNVRKDKIKSGTICFNDEDSPFKWVDLFGAGPATLDLVDQQLFRDRRAGRRRAGDAPRRAARPTRRPSSSSCGSSPGSRIAPRTAARPAPQAADHADPLGTAAGSRRLPRRASSFPLVLEPRRAAPLAGDDEVEVAVAVHVGDAEVHGRPDAFASRDGVPRPGRLGTRFSV